MRLHPSSSFIIISPRNHIRARFLPGYNSILRITVKLERCQEYPIFRPSGVLATSNLQMLIGEVMFWLFSSRPRKTVYANCGECKVHLFTRRLLRFIGGSRGHQSCSSMCSSSSVPAVFLCGALVTQIFVDTIKLMTGYQRPYFLSLCNVSIK